MQPEKYKETQHTKKNEKNNKKTKQKTATLFFSFQSMRYFIRMENRRVASKMARQMYAKNTRKRAHKSVQNKC